MALISHSIYYYVLTRPSSLDPRPHMATYTSLQLHLPTFSPECDVVLDGPNDGFNTGLLGLYEYQGLDTYGVSYFKLTYWQTEEWFMYLVTEPEPLGWVVSSTPPDDFDETTTKLAWVGARISKSPTSVLSWSVSTKGTIFLRQPGVSASYTDTTCDGTSPIVQI